MRDLEVGLFMALARYVAPEDMELQCRRGRCSASRTDRDLACGCVCK